PPCGATRPLSRDGQRAAVEGHGMTPDHDGKDHPGGILRYRDGDVIVELGRGASCYSVAAARAFALEDAQLERSEREAARKEAIAHLTLLGLGDNVHAIQRETEK